MANGSSTCDGHYTAIKGVYCENCGVKLKTFILGRFSIISESPFWQPLKAEKAVAQTKKANRDWMLEAFNPP